MCYFLFLNLAIIMNSINLRFTRTDHLCVLVIINIHTFSGLLISWIFIMFMYMKCTVFCMQNIVIDK